jgi:hypothetical protein
VNPDGRDSRKNWLGTMAVWLSGISALVYFLTSHGVKNQVILLLDNFNKALEKIGTF